MPVKKDTVKTESGFGLLKAMKCEWGAFTLRKTVEKIEPLDNAMLNYLKTVPVSELITRARGDYVFLKVNPTRDKVTLHGAQPRVDKWIVALKPRRDEILEFLLADSNKESSADDEAAREVEIVLVACNE